MQLLTLPKLAAQSGWPESRVRRMVARGLLSHIRVNGRLLLPETAIEGKRCFQTTAVQGISSLTRLAG